SEDPLGLEPGSNPDQCVGNGPTNAVDPNGLLGISTSNIKKQLRAYRRQDGSKLTKKEIRLRLLILKYVKTSIILSPEKVPEKRSDYWNKDDEPIEGKAITAFKSLWWDEDNPDYIPNTDPPKYAIWCRALVSIVIIRAEIALAERNKSSSKRKRALQKIAT